MGESKNREPPRSEETQTLRIRGIDPVLLSCAALGLGILSFLWNSRREDLAYIEHRTNQITNDRFHEVITSLNDLRELDREINARQDKEIEWLRIKIEKRK